LFFVFAFLTGWWTHQWLFSEGEPKATTSQEGKEGEEVALIEGKLFYQDHAGNRHPDDGAVVMLLPAEDPPDTPLPVNQLHPKKPMPGDNHPTIRRWKEAGAYYLRTREDGTFALRLDDPGTYDVLMISANASRLTDELDEVTEQRLKPYFAIPKLPIGTYRYAVREMDLSTGTEPIEHDFGSSELVIPELRGEDRDQAKSWISEREQAGIVFSPCIPCFERKKAREEIPPVPRFFHSASPFGFRGQGFSFAN
jgi:hypothetical protein